MTTMVFPKKHSAETYRSRLIKQGANVSPIRPIGSLYALEYSGLPTRTPPPPDHAPSTPRVIARTTVTETTTSRKPPSGRHRYKVWLKERGQPGKQFVPITKLDEPITEKGMYYWQERYPEPIRVKSGSPPEGSIRIGTALKLSNGSVQVGTSRKGMPVYAGPTSVVYLIKKGSLSSSWKPDKGWPASWKPLLKDSKMDTKNFNSNMKALYRTHGLPIYARRDRLRGYMMPSGRVQKQGRSI